ncbi:MAG: PAS domain S-box protein [Acidobacteriia bacterium]|nr:PAS domain S-box protein [Terriglobia bacterium]
MDTPKPILEVSFEGALDQEIKQNDERFRLLLQAAPDAILEVDASGRITLANVAAESMFGYPGGDLVGRSIEELVPAALRNAHIRHRAAYAGNSKRRPMGVGRALEAQKRDGTLFAVEISLSPTTSVDTENVIAIVRDVSQRNEMEKMLHRSEERLRQAEKLEALGRLAGGVAHEFNNLLTMILGYSELLLPSVPAGDPRSYVEKISLSARRAASLTRQLLAFSRSQTLTPRVLDLNTVVVESCHIVSRLLGENVELVVLPAAEPAWVKIDPAQIDQIMANLATNAHAAMPDGGKLTVAVSHANLDEKNIHQYPGLAPGKYVLLSVSDTGSGMPPEVKARLFEPFFSTREFGQGAGLGLASIYGIVKQSGGNISVRSEPGSGTTFYIFLPNVQPDDIESDPLKKEKNSETFRGDETILLVEDQEPLLDLSREFLERLGYRVLAASQPDKAVQVSQNFAGAIDLLLTDVVMPGMNGRQLASQLKLQRPTMKVLFVSGFADRAFETAGPLGAMETFMEKPYGFEELGLKIRTILH